MNKFKGFTYSKHMEIGRRLCDLHFRIWKLFFFLQERYPKTSRPMRAMLRLAGGASGPFVDLKNELDKSFFADCPGRQVSESPYYGWHEPGSKGKLNIIPLSAFIRQRKPSVLAPDEHADVSARLRSIEHELKAIRDEIWKAYGASSRPGRGIGRVVAGNRIINEVRLAMGYPREQNSSKEVSHE